MGEIRCCNDRLLSKINYLKGSSARLDKIISKILENGDLDISIVNSGHSTSCQRRIILAARDGMSKQEVESKLVVELCNTYYEVRGMKPHIKQHNEAKSYGEAMERMEWKSVKKHVNILNELKQSSNYLGDSKYEKVFARQGWGKFENYLNDQRDNGHTARIEGHWHKHQ